MYRLHAYYKNDDDAVILTYKDDGKGIEKEYIDKIFNPFFTTKRGQGAVDWGFASSTIL